MTPRILIVGAGIGGLTLAQCFQKRNINFDLVERRQQTGPLGAGLSLTINATRLLEALGLGEELRRLGCVYQSGWIRNDQDTVLQHLDLRSLSRYGEAVAIHRADLHHVLAHGLQPQYGREVTDLSVSDDDVEVAFQGERASYDLVVAADGLHSSVRKSQSGTVSSVYSGYTSWRYTQPDPLGLSDPVEYWGAGRRLGLVPIGQGQLYVFATLNSPPLVERPGFPWVLFRDYPAPVRQVMNSMPVETNVIQTDIRELTTHVWHSPRVAFLGDSAHGMTPNLGQGAGTSIEDAVVLAECIYQHGITEAAQTLYREVRQRRVEGISAQSRWLGHLGQIEHPLLLRLRDWTLSHTPTSVTQRNALKVMIQDAPQPPRY